MGMTRSLIKTSGLIVALILVGCSLLTAWAFISYVKPKVGTIFDQIVSKYDAFLPEIVLRNGHASIRGPQPYFIDTRGEKDLALVIDTREEKQKDGLDYLKDVANGVVLTRDTLITKQEGQIRIIPLKGMPDFELNSRTLQELAARYAPQATGIALGAVIAYYLAVKLFQVLILALVPYLALRSYKVPLRYGEALKVAVFCMIPPVLYDTFLYFLDVRVPWSFVIYFAAFVGLLALAAKDLIKNFRAEEDPSLSAGLP
jgi:hypothetical protein